MCGRYALALRAGQVRQRLQESNMPSQQAPDDDEARETYNFAPGYFGLVYRADVPDRGAGQDQAEKDQDPSHEAGHEAGNGAGADVAAETEAQGDVASADTAKESEETSKPTASQDDGAGYKLQAMKWGLIPFWTKRSPDYGSMMRTINARDDSLAQKSGMWTTMKQKKRCVVIAQGFYEWLKKGPGGRDKVPHFVKRKDGQLMCFAGLWDSVQFDDAPERLHTYTIITTAANAQLAFLHDRMPVILDAGSPALFAWLDRAKTAWSPDLQALLRPFAGELECYPVPKDVGKVGNNSPSFIVPVDSAENKQNIANFFGNQKKAAAAATGNADANATQTPREQTGDEANADEQPQAKAQDAVAGSKRARSPPNDASDKQDDADEGPSPKAPKTTPARATRSATSNNASPGKTKTSKSPAKPTDGSQRITSFFKT